MFKNLLIRNSILRSPKMENLQYWENITSDSEVQNPEHSLLYVKDRGAHFGLGGLKSNIGCKGVWGRSPQKNFL